MSQHDPSVLSRASVLLGLALALPQLIAGCGGGHGISRPPDTSQGVSADYVARPVHTIDFGRFVLGVTAYDWDAHGHLDSSWHFDGKAWTKLDSGYSSTFVGAVGGPTVEVRDETVTSLVVQFFNQGRVEEDLMSADGARLHLRVRQRRYAVDPSVRLDEAYDISAVLASEFRLTAASPDTLRATGVVSGWWERAEGGGHPRVDYSGSVEMAFDFPGHYVACPAERMAADIRLLRQGVELDRFTGSFGAGAGEDAFTGALQSERGPWRFAINDDRGCPGATSRAPAPAPLRMTAERGPR